MKKIIAFLVMLLILISFSQASIASFFGELSKNIPIIGNQIGDIITQFGKKNEIKIKKEVIEDLKDTYEIKLKDLKKSFETAVKQETEGMKTFSDIIKPFSNAKECVYILVELTHRKYEKILKSNNLGMMKVFETEFEQNWWELIKKVKEFNQKMTTSSKTKQIEQYIYNELNTYILTVIHTIKNIERNIKFPFKYKNLTNEMFKMELPLNIFKSRTQTLNKEDEIKKINEKLSSYFYEHENFKTILENIKKLIIIQDTIITYLEKSILEKK